MGLWRTTLLCCGSLLAGTAFGQAVQHKHLVMSLGGGGGLTTFQSNADTLQASALLSSAVRFAFSYGLGDRWSIGGHYDRIGSVVHPREIERVRSTTYMIEGIYRPFNGQKAAIETSLGLGAYILALRPNDALIPYRSMGPVVNVGVRYMHFINETIGLFMAFDHAQAGKSELQLHDAPVVNSVNDPLHMSWHSQRFTAGMIVKF